MALLSAVPLACGASKPAPTGEGVPVITGGTRVYPNTDLRTLSYRDASLAFVTSTAGLSTVEVIHGIDGGFEAVPIQSPPPEDHTCKTRMPVAVAVADLNADSVDDVLVFDPCGNWIALGSPAGDFEPMPWTALLPAVPSYPFLSTLQTSMQSFVFAGLDSQLTQIAGTGGNWGTPTSQSLPSPYLGDRVTDLWTVQEANLPTDGRRLLVQSDQELLAFAILGAAGIDGAQVTTFTQTIQPGYLIPFDGFDHLSSVSLPGCAPTALGVGVVPAAAGSFPRTLQRLTFQLGTFGTQEIPTGLESVTTIAVAQRESQGDALVIALGLKGGLDELVLWSMDCQGMTELLQMPIEFSWRAPPAPQFGQAALAKTDGVKLVSMTSGNEIDFAHYDGYDVRVFRAIEGAEGWRASEDKYSLHGSRDDLAYADPTASP